MSDLTLLSPKKSEENQEICAVCSAPRADDPIGRDPERCDFCANYRPRPELVSGPGRVVSFLQSNATKPKEGRYDIAA